MHKHYQENLHKFMIIRLLYKIINHKEANYLCKTIVDIFRNESVFVLIVLFCDAKIVLRKLLELTWMVIDFICNTFSVIIYSKNFCGLRNVDHQLYFFVYSLFMQNCC